MINNKRVLAVIPARLGSSRLPRKILRDIAGKSLIRRVYERALQVRAFDRIIIAVDAEDSMEHVLGFGAECRMTSVSHQSGTDRCAEIASAMPEYDLIVNMQGDEPFVAPDHLMALVGLISQDHVALASLMCGLSAPEDFFNPNLVKVAADNTGRALYFSRAPIPYQRASEPGHFQLNDSSFRHIGLYAYKRDALMEISALAQGRLESIEMLEQLRWLENGFDLHLARVDAPGHGIDTEEDLERAIRHCLENDI